jgi:DNA-binding SARP family transcriptional activator
MREAVELLRVSDSPRDLACALAGEAFALGLVGDVSASNTAFEESIALVRTLEEASVLTMFILFSRGRIAYVAGDLTLARASLEAALDCGPSRGASLLMRHVLTALGRVDLDEGRTGDAAWHLKECLRLHSVTRDTWGTLIGLVGLARAAAQSHPRDAATLLAAAGALRDRMGVRLLQFRITEHESLAAALRQTLGDDDFLAATNTGLQLDADAAIALGLAIPIIPNVMPAPQRGPPSASAALPTKASGPPRHAPSSDLRVLALGPLEIEYRGSPVTRDAWRSAKPRELLLYLLVHRRGKTRDEVGLAFWPDASPSEVKNNVHVTMHRLRRVLEGADCIILDKDRYRLSPDLRVDFDAEIFDESATESLRALRHSAPGAAAALAAALSWFRGDFGEGERFGDWHVEPRDRLSRLYTVGLLAWAESAAGNRRFAEAAGAYRRLIARDPLNEAAYRGLMVALDAQGDRVQALKLFQQLTTLLRAELDTVPSAETMRIHRDLQGVANA